MACEDITPRPETVVDRVEPPALPVAHEGDGPNEREEHNNVLRLFFNRLIDALDKLRQAIDNTNTDIDVLNGVVPRRYRYWRLVNANAQGLSGGPFLPTALTLEELSLYESVDEEEIEVTTEATVTSTAPDSGADVVTLSDGVYWPAEVEPVIWDYATVTDPTFFIQWDFGEDNPKAITYLRQFPSSTDTIALANKGAFSTFQIQASDDGVTWDRTFYVSWQHESATNLLPVVGEDTYSEYYWIHEHDNSAGGASGGCDCITLCPSDPDPGYSCSALSDELLAQGMQYIVELTEDAGAWAYPFSTASNAPLGNTTLWSAWNQFASSPFLLPDWNASYPEKETMTSWSWADRAAEYQQCEISVKAEQSVNLQASGLVMALTPPDPALEASTSSSSNFVFTGYAGGNNASIQARFRPAAIWQVIHTGGTNNYVEGFLAVNIESNPDRIIVFCGQGGGQQSDTVLTGETEGNWVNVTITETSYTVDQGSGTLWVYTEAKVTATNQDGTSDSTTVLGYKETTVGGDILSAQTQDHANLATVPRFMYGTDNGNKITIASIAYNNNTLVTHNDIGQAFLRNFNTYTPAPPQTGLATLEQNDFLRWDDVDECFDTVQLSPPDNQLYSIRNGVEILNPIQLDAPADDKQYARKNNGWDQVVGSGSGGRTLLSEQILIATAALITFGSISQSYNRLWLVGFARADGVSAEASDLDIAFNADTTITNYSNQRSSGANGSSFFDHQNNNPTICAISADDSPTNAFGTFEIMLEGYALSNFAKYAGCTYRNLRNTGASAGLEVGNRMVWHKTLVAPITQIELSIPTGGAVFRIGSTFRLYGEM
jgi:hypothetical protein